MLPGNLKGLPDESFNSVFGETLVFIDDGFLAKLSDKTICNKLIGLSKLSIIKCTSGLLGNRGRLK